MNLVELNELFDVKYGNKFDANKMNFVPNGDINFISRDSKNNGCVGTVGKYNDMEPFEEGLITVSLGGSFLLSSFLQPKRFYTAQNVAVLTPKNEMTVNEMIYYCKCLSMNRFKYSAFGREANKTLKNLKVPCTVPLWVQENNIKDISEIKKPFCENNLSLEKLKMEFLQKASKWKKFKYEGNTGVFTIKGGYYNKKPEHTEKGNVPFIGAIGSSNGITDYYSLYDIENNHKDDRGINHPLSRKIFKGNSLTVVNNGASVGCAFYQENDFTCSHDINVLYLKNREWNKYIALFISTLIQLEKYRWTYGRKWRPIRMRQSEIKLPVDSNGEIDWDFMENFIKGLPYSKCLEPIQETEFIAETIESVQKTKKTQSTLIDF
ncbi:restriction endonuclease subunit S [Methanosarcina sp.]|uniref:restriction endonuclease subunit S n=1 Tax=Methanosarcina sp. TaxID=2213 RepID=UPI003BB55A22